MNNESRVSLLRGATANTEADALKTTASEEDIDPYLAVLSAET